MNEGELSVLVVSLLFLIFSAFFSSSEAAFLSLQKTRLTHLVNTGVPGARRVATMVQEPERLLATILLGNNLVNVAFAALVTVVIVSLLGEGRGVIVATVVATVILLIIGEIIPKTIAVRHAERIAFWYAKPLKTIELLLFPLVIALQWVTNRVNSRFDNSETQSSITEDELRTLIDIGEAEGTFAPSEAEMLEKVFRFGDRHVREVMTPRTEFVAVERGSTLNEFLRMYSMHPHTRFPVYKETPDNIIGIISAKDILKALTLKNIGDDFVLTDLIRDAYFIPETKLIAELFDELRRSGNQMSIVVDEFGGLAGLVTLKSLSEVVVGSVGEEGTGAEEEYEAIGKNAFQIDGGMSIEEANEELNINLPDGDFETIAGFVLDVLGHIPVEGEQFDYEKLRFVVSKIDNRKIENITVTKMNSQQF